MYRVAQRAPPTPGTPAFDNAQNVPAWRVLPSSLQKGSTAVAGTPRAAFQAGAPNLQSQHAPRIGSVIQRQRSVEVPRERLLVSTTPRPGSGMLTPRPASPALQRSHIPLVVPKAAAGLQQSSSHAAMAGPSQEVLRLRRPQVGISHGPCERVGARYSVPHAELPKSTSSMDSASLLKDVHYDLRTLLAKLSQTKVATPEVSLSQRVEQFEQIVFARLRDLEQKLPHADVPDEVYFNGKTDFDRNAQDRLFTFGDHTDTTPTLSGGDLEMALGKDDTDLDAESPNTLSIDVSVIVVRVVRSSLEDRLGLDVRHIDGQLCVERIDADGAVARANMRNLTMDPPGDVLDLGDVIFRINDIEFCEEENSDKWMVEECQRKLDLVIHAIRP